MKFLHYFGFRFISCACVLVVVFVHFVTGQTTTRRNPREVVRESNRRELDSLLLRKPISTIEDPSARQAALKQINEDFKAVQVLNNSLVSALKQETQDLNYKELANVLSQLGSKASRLQEGLLLPEVEIEKSDKLFDKVNNVQQFKDAVVEFDKVVGSFALNPIFQQKNVIDVELAKRASRDLELIIRESARLKKAAQKLKVR